MKHIAFTLFFLHTKQLSVAAAPPCGDVAASRILTAARSAWGDCLGEPSGTTSVDTDWINS